jgi:2-(1,2-epoxy-1,2-dihydrophenyl)acetyl-CoA isomerase
MRTVQKEKTILTQKGPVGIITLNSPKTMNALDDVLFSELAELTDQLLNDPDIGAIVLTGSGNAFCAGGDVKRFAEGVSPVEGHLYMKGFHPWVERFMKSEKPTVAAVNGYAIGAGFCIAMLADIAYAANSAKFGMAFGNVGLIPDLAGLYTLPRLIGLQRARELVFTCRNIAAQQAMDWGIVSKVTEPENLLDEALKLAALLAEGPRVALNMAKKLLNSSLNTTFEQMLVAEASAQALCFQTEDHKNAVKSFLNKEKPVFKGR